MRQEIRRGPAHVPGRAANGPVPDGTGRCPHPERLLEVRQLSVAYATERRPVVAVDDVDLDLDSGEFLAVVGRVRLREVDAVVRNRAIAQPKRPA